MLEVTDICKTFNPGTVNEKIALNGLSLTHRDGDFVTVIGGNGAGKSTLLNAVAGVWPVDGGKIFIDGVDVTGLPEYRRARYIGRVFQDPMMGTAPTMQIKRISRWPPVVAAAERCVPHHGRGTEEYHEKLKMLELGLESRMTARVGLLSGGQRQALTLLMATLREPKLLLLDDIRRRSTPPRPRRCSI